MDLLEFLGYELPNADSEGKNKEEFDVDRARRYFNDLERAIDSTAKATGYSEDEHLIDEVDSVVSEMNWAGDAVRDLFEAYSDQLDHIYELEALVGYLVDEVYARMDEDEIKQFEQAQIMAKLKAKETT